MMVADHQRSGKITWTTMRSGVEVTDDTVHPNGEAKSDYVQVPVGRSRDAWLRLTNAITVSDPSLTVTVYGRMTGGVWARLGQMNGGNPIVPTTGQALQETNRVNHTERFVGLGAWDEIWASITGTFGDDGGGPAVPGTADLEIGWEDP